MVHKRTQTILQNVSRDAESLPKDLELTGIGKELFLTLQDAKGPVFLDDLELPRGNSWSTSAVLDSLRELIRKGLAKLVIVSYLLRGWRRACIPGEFRSAPGIVKRRLEGSIRRPLNSCPRGRHRQVDPRKELRQCNLSFQAPRLSPSGRPVGPARSAEEVPEASSPNH